MRGVENMPLEIAADGDVVQRDVLDLHQRLGREPRLGDRVVLELQIGRVLHERRPIRAGAGAHRPPTFSTFESISCPAHRPSTRTVPRSSPAGTTTKTSASSSQWYSRSP